MPLGSNLGHGQGVSPVNRFFIPVAVFASVFLDVPTVETAAPQPTVRPAPTFINVVNVGDEYAPPQAAPSPEFDDSELDLPAPRTLSIWLRQGVAPEDDVIVPQGVAQAVFDDDGWTFTLPPANRALLRSSLIDAEDYPGLSAPSGSIVYEDEGVPFAQTRLFGPTQLPVADEEYPLYVPEAEDGFTIVITADQFFASFGSRQQVSIADEEYPSLSTPAVSIAYEDEHLLPPSKISFLRLAVPFDLVLEGNVVEEPGKFPHITGVTRNSAGTPLPGCRVAVFKTSDDSLVVTGVSDASGIYLLPVPNTTDNLYVVAYRADAPDIFGTTVNWLTGVL